MVISKGLIMPSEIVSYFRWELVLLGNNQLVSRAHFGTIKIACIFLTSYFLSEVVVRLFPTKGYGRK